MTSSPSRQSGPHQVSALPGGVQKGPRILTLPVHFSFPSATGAAKIVTVPFGELVPAPQLESKSEDGVSDYCHFSDGEEEDELEGRVAEVPPK